MKEGCTEGPRQRPWQAFIGELGLILPLFFDLDFDFDFAFCCAVPAIGRPWQSVSSFSLKVSAQEGSAVSVCSAGGGREEEEKEEEGGGGGGAEEAFACFTSVLFSLCSAIR